MFLCFQTIIYEPAHKIVLTKMKDFWVVSPQFFGVKTCFWNGLQMASPNGYWVVFEKKRGSKNKVIMQLEQPVIDYWEEEVVADLLYDTQMIMCYTYN